MRTHPRARLVVTLLLAGSAAAGVSLAHARPACAQARPAQADPTATAQFNEGLERYAAQDFEGARVAFEQAYATLKAADVLFNLALAELRSNRPVEAYGHLAQYLRDDRPTADERAKARRFLEEARSKTGRVLVVAQAGADVLVDGAPRGTAPMADPITVLPGKHLLASRLAGKTEMLELTVRGGEVVTARLGRSDVDPPSPWSSPSTDAPAPSPTDTSPHARGGTGWGTGKLVTVIGLGTAAAGALVGAVLFKVGQDSARSDAQALADANVGARCGVAPEPPACARAADLKSSYDSDRTLAGVFFGAGLGLAAGAVAAAFLWPNDDDAAKKGGRVVPVVTAGGMSLAWTGRF